MTSSPSLGISPTARAGRNAATTASKKRPRTSRRSPKRRPDALIERRPLREQKPPRSLPFPALLDDPPLQRRAFDGVNPAVDDDFEYGRQCGKRHAIGKHRSGLAFRGRDIKVR